MLHPALEMRVARRADTYVLALSCSRWLLCEVLTAFLGLYLACMPPKGRHQLRCQPPAKPRQLSLPNEPPAR